MEELIRKNYCLVMLGGLVNLLLHWTRGSYPTSPRAPEVYSSLHIISMSYIVMGHFLSIELFDPPFGMLLERETTEETFEQVLFCMHDF